MKPKVIHNILLCSFCLALYCLCNADKFLSSRYEWKKLIMVHHWPPTVCKEAENDCSNPPGYWTIHGLWADKAEDCNRSWHFNLEEIKDLLPEMKMYWPDIIHRPPNCSQFWKHEWRKHGTCVAQLDALNSEKKYFGKILDLYKQLNLDSMLQKLGIKPSIDYYQVADIRDALASVYGVMPKVQCLPPEKNEDVQSIAQIELCFTKDLQLRNCTQPRLSASLRQKARGADVADSSMGLEVCEDGPVFYPRPERPCADAEIVEIPCVLKSKSKKCTSHCFLKNSKVKSVYNSFINISRLLCSFHFRVCELILGVHVKMAKF